jgi:sugar/nucleoside kinase (ribokinase family)
MTPGQGRIRFISMPNQSRTLVEAPRGKSFDVICAGEALVHLNAPAAASPSNNNGLRFRPGGGAVRSALALARTGLRVGLATAIGDDSVGRALHERIAAAGVDVGGVALTPPRAEVVFVQGTGDESRIVSLRGEDAPFSVPETWTAPVLLLSGLSPVVSYAAALCKAARAARRTGTIVVVDINARRHLWSGQDPRAIRMLLREADVVRCSTADLAVLFLDVESVRASMRSSGVLVMTSASGDAWATGPFGEVAVPALRADLARPVGAGDVLTAVICADLARAGDAGVDRADRWTRTLARGQAAIAERSRR